MIVVAHRGASKAERENTIAAFVRAREMGSHMVELDVRRTADGAMVVHHDPRIAAIGNLVDIARASLPSYVPDLADALDACAGIDVNVEIKSQRQEPDYDRSQQLARNVAELLMSRDDHHRMLVTSFDMATIRVVREVAPQIRTGFLYTRPRLVQATFVADVVQRGHVALHPHHRGVNRQLVDLAHAAGIQVNTWTVDDPNRMRELRDWGVDAVITNVPDVALAALAG